ncbi:MAG TPA: APC family permease, partial [Anaerolineae bacterium]
MNTGVRISFAMAQDAEMPELMGLLHGKYATPYAAVIVMVIVSALIGTVGVLGGVTALTGITLASNLGTFVLYALICALTVVAFAGGTDFNLLKHGLIPALGLLTNVIMVGAIFIIGIMSGGVTAQATYLALGVSAGWLLISVIYFIVTSKSSGRAILPQVSAALPVKKD